MKYLFTFLFLILTWSFLNSSCVVAQNMNSRDLSTINSDELSESQVRELGQQMQVSGISDEQFSQSAISRGMDPQEVQKLVNRINSLQNPSDQDSSSKTTSRNNNKNQDKKNQQNFPIDSVKNFLATALDNLRPKIFGADLFRNTRMTFEPNLRLATPPNYILGPDDQLLISVYGKSVIDWKLNVNPEGYIQIPRVGNLNIGGRTIEQALLDIKKKLASNHYAIGNGTYVQVSLGNIRSIKVVLVGEIVRPGTYTLSSLSTVFNALYASGGPNQNGSFREIEIIRDNKLYRKLDTYDFLLKGVQKNNITLQDQDIIRVPTFKVRVTVLGEVKRPSLYEVIPGENLKDVISFSGGFSDQAYTSRIKVLQVTGKEHRITDVIEADYGNYIPLRGDKYVVDPILKRFENRVSIKGAVFRPGTFELEKNMTLSQLITKSDGLKEDAFSERGYINRLKSDNTSELIAFDIKGIENKTVPDLLLQREDEVTIPSIFDLRDSLKVVIKGEVRKTGDYKFSDGMTVEDLILKAGGFTQAATSSRVEIARRIKNGDPKSASSAVAQVFQMNVDKDLKVGEGSFTLMPFDIISIYSLPGYEKQKSLKIEGEVIYPGYYTIKEKNERISDIIRRAGGFTAAADISGSSLKRSLLNNIDTTKNKLSAKDLQEERNDRILRLRGAAKDTSTTLLKEEIKHNQFVGIDMLKIIKKPGSRFDLIVEDGDVVRVPKEAEIVKVSGEILFPSLVIFFNNKSVLGYIDNAGGFSPNALKSRVYVVYANGTVKSTHKFLFWNNYPSAKAGCEIIVPKKQDKRKLSAGEVVGITTGIASFGAIILTIINLLHL